MAGTLLIRRITTLMSGSVEICINLSAAAKNMGPLISYTRVCFGTLRRLILSGSLSSSIASPRYSQLLISATSDILFRKRSAAITMPTSIATTRSKITVNTKVTVSTAISLLGDDFTRRRNSLQPDMLYATWNRIAAMAGMGIQAA